MANGQQQDRSISLDGARSAQSRDKPQQQSTARDLGEDDPALEVTLKSHQASLSGRKVRVMINEGEGEIGKSPVEIGYNGFAYQIPRNLEVVLPEEVFDACIKGARYDIHESTKDGVKTRIVNRFSYSMLGTIAAPQQAAA